MAGLKEEIAAVKNAVTEFDRSLGNGDPNGIRTRVTAVKGRCPGPLDDRVTKPGNIGIEPPSRKANCRGAGLLHAHLFVKMMLYVNHV